MSECSLGTPCAYESGGVGHAVDRLKGARVKLLEISGRAQDVITVIIGEHYHIECCNTHFPVLGCTLLLECRGCEIRSIIRGGISTRQMSGRAGRMAMSYLHLLHVDLQQTSEGLFSDKGLHLKPTIDQ